MTAEELICRLRNGEHILREDARLEIIREPLSAEVARKLSDKSCQKSRETEFNNIMDKIKEETDYGGYNYIIDGYISDENVKRLQNLGYKVTIADEDCGSYLYTEIEW